MNDVDIRRKLRRSLIDKHFKGEALRVIDCADNLKIWTPLTKQYTIRSYINLVEDPLKIHREIPKNIVDADHDKCWDSWHQFIGTVDQKTIFFLRVILEVNKPRGMSKYTQKVTNFNFQAMDDKFLIDGKLFPKRLQSAIEKMSAPYHLSEAYSRGNDILEISGYATPTMEYLGVVVEPKDVNK